MSNATFNKINKRIVCEKRCVCQLSDLIDEEGDVSMRVTRRETRHEGGIECLLFEGTRQFRKDGERHLGKL